MKIANGLYVLELYVNGNGAPRVFSPTLIYDNETAVLIDTGLPGQLQNIKDEMEKADVPFEKLQKIIITHHDMDHIGSLSSVLKAANHKIEVLSHEGERPYIQGEKIPIKMTAERLAELEAQPEMKAVYANIKAGVDTLVHDGQELAFYGGIEVIHTPGHTPGHICLYLKKYKALVTGDAMNVVGGKLVGPNPVFTFNMDLALNSLKKLTKYDIETVICYHGGVFTDNPNQRIAVLAAE